MTTLSTIVNTKPSWNKQINPYLQNTCYRQLCKRVKYLKYLFFCRNHSQ